MTEGQKDGRTEGQNDGKTEFNDNTSFDKLRMTDERISELEEVNSELMMRNEELERGIRINEYREFVNSLIDFEAGGIITPAEGEELVDILVKVDRFDMEFSEGEGKREKGEGSVAKRIKELFNGMKPRVSGALFSDSFTGDSRRSFDKLRMTADGKVNMNLETDFSKMENVYPERMELHRKAKEIQLGNSCLTYEEAVNQALSL